LVGELVVWIDHKDYVRRQRVFLGEELFCTLVEFGWRSRIDKEDLSSRRSKLRDCIKVGGGHRGE
jgi:hypothetical protein